MPHHGVEGHMGKHQVGQEAEGVGGNAGKSLHWGFLGKESVRQGCQAYNWLV